jgi:hypothetical protein
MGYDKKIQNVLVLGECAPIALADKEVWEWQQRWREVYARELHAETGTWTYHGLDWHVFSFDKHPSKQGDRAWSEYRRLSACSFLVLSSDIQHTFGFSCTGKPPERLDRGIDIVIAPHSMEWTMAFNHEHYGPYFAVP